MHGIVMTRRGLLAGSFALLAEPPAAQAQPAGKVARIGFLSPASPTSGPHIVEAFRQGPRDLGYVEGENIGRFAGMQPIHTRCFL